MTHPRRTGRTALHLLFAVLVVALAARVSVSVPGTPVPQSLQTLAVVLVGAWLGSRVGALALVAYALAGAAGLPVFADGASGVAHLTGPTAGYLVGFVLSASWAGWWRESGRCDRLVPAVIGMLLAHGLILFMGWLRLSGMRGPIEAFEQGVAPFLWGGALKAVLAAVLVVAAASPRRPTPSPRSD